MSQLLTSLCSVPEQTATGPDNKDQFKMVQDFRQNAGVLSGVSTVPRVLVAGQGRDAETLARAYGAAGLGVDTGVTQPGLVETGRYGLIHWTDCRGWFVDGLQGACVAEQRVAPVMGLLSVAGLRGPQLAQLKAMTGVSETHSSPGETPGFFYLLPLLASRAVTRLRSALANGMAGRLQHVDLTFPEGLGLYADADSPTGLEACLGSILWCVGENPGFGAACSVDKSGRRTTLTCADRLTVVLHRVTPGNAIELWFTGVSGQLGLIRHSDRVEVLARASGKTIRLMEDRVFDPLAEMAMTVAKALRSRQWVGAPGVSLLASTARCIDALVSAGFEVTGLDKSSAVMGSKEVYGPDNPQPAPPSDVNETVVRHMRDGGMSDVAEPPVINQEVKIDIEASCNFNCSFCYATGKRTVVESDASFESELASARERGVSAVVLSGGEPLMNARVVDWIARARTSGMTHITIETNASLVGDAGYAKRLVEAGLTSAFVSYHAPRAILAERITGVPGSWEATELGMSLLIDAGIETNVNCVVTRHNLDSLSDLVVRVHECFAGIRSLTLSFPVPAGDACNPEVLPRLSEAASPMSAALLLAERLGLEVRIPGRCGVPFCVLPGLERFMVDYHWGMASTERVMQLQRDHVKVPACRACAFDRICRGVWTGYVGLYGTDELNPLMGDRF